MPRSWSVKVRRLACVSVCLILVVLPPTVAYAGFVQTYRQSQNQQGGQWSTFDPEYANRSFNRVYHQAGTTWGLRACTYVYGCVPYDYGTTNPLTDVGGDDLMMWCYNVNDSSGVNWTCQSTVGYL